MMQKEWQIEDVASVSDFELSGVVGFRVSKDAIG